MQHCGRRDGSEKYLSLVAANLGIFALTMTEAPVTRQLASPEMKHLIHNQKSAPDTT